MNNNQIPIKGSPARALAAATLGFFFGATAISLFGPTATQLKVVMGLTPAEVGVLVAIPTLSGSLLRIPFGASVDVNGGRRPFILLLALAVVGLAGLSFLLGTQFPEDMKGTYWLILLLGCLSGCGIATFSVGTGQSSYWYAKKRQGFALGVFGGLGTMSAGILAIVLPVLLKYAGFINAYYGLTVFMFIGLILYILLACNAPYFQFLKSGRSPEESHHEAKKHGQELFPAGNIRQSLSISARVPETWILVIAYFVTFGGFLALTAWLPTYWQQMYGMTSMEAGGLTATFAILAAGLRVPGGQLSDHFGGLQVSIFAITLLGLVTLILSFVTNWMPALFCTLAISLAFGLNNAAIMKLVPAYVPKSVGGASGWVGGLGAFGGFVLPPAMGKVAGSLGMIGYARGFLIFTVLSAIVLVILYLGLLKRERKVGAPKE